MTIYDIVIFVIPLLAFILRPVGLYPNQFSEHNSKKFLLLVGILLVLIPGLRDHTIGLDTFQYENYWMFMPKDVLDAFQESRFEEGYILLNFLLKNTSFILVQLVTSALMIGFAFNMIRKYSPMIWFSCVLFIIYCFYYKCFNEMRQAVAMGVVCYSMNYLVEKSLKHFIICLFLAALFHRTSLIFLPAALLVYINRIRWWQIGGLMVALVVLTIYAGTVVQTFLPFFETDYSNMEVGAGGWGLFAFQIMTFCLLLTRFYYLREDRTNAVLLYLIGMAPIIFPICHLNPMLFRLQDYFWIFMIIAVPRLICTYKSLLIRILAISLYSMVGYIFVFKNLFSEHAQTVPYHFFFE